MTKPKCGLNQNYVRFHPLTIGFAKHKWGLTKMYAALPASSWVNPHVCSSNFHANFPKLLMVTLWQTNLACRKMSEKSRQFSFKVSLVPHSSFNIYGQ